MCGNYSREETIQGRKLYEEIRYTKLKSHLSPYWTLIGMRGDNFISFLDQILSAEFLSTCSKLFGGKNWHQSVYFDTLPRLLNLFKVAPRCRYWWAFFFFSKVIPIRVKDYSYTSYTLYIIRKMAIFVSLFSGVLKETGNGKFSVLWRTFLFK